MKKVIMAIAGVLVSAAAIVGILFATNKTVANAMRKAVLSDDKYLAYVLQDNFKNAVSKAFKNYDENVLSDIDFANMKIDSTSKLTMGPQAETLMGVLGESADYVNWIKDIQFDYAYCLNQGGMQVDGKVGVNGTDLMTLSMVIADSTEYMVIPELSDKYIAISMDAMMGQVLDQTTSSLQDVKELYPSKAVLENMAKNYGTAVIGAIDGDIESEKQEITIVGTNVDVTAMTIDMAGEVGLNMRKSVDEVFLQDQDLKDLMEKYYNYYSKAGVFYGNDSFEDNYEELCNNAREDIEEIKEQLQSGEFEENAGKITFYIDSKGVLLGMDFLDEEGVVLSIKSTTEGKNFSLDITSDIFEITGTGEQTDTSITNAKYDFYFDGERICTFDIDKVVFDPKNRSSESEFRISHLLDSDLMGSLVDDTPYSAMLRQVLGEDIIIKTSVKNFADVHTEVLYGEGSNNLFALSVDGKITSGGDLSVPSQSDCVYMNGTDENAIYKYLASIKDDAIIGKLEEAGASQAVLDMTKGLYSTIEYLKLFF